MPDAASVPAVAPPVTTPGTTHLVREMTVVGLVATALAAMTGVGINIIPFMIQRWRPGVGDMVPMAFVVAAVPAVMAALCYAVLSSAMPRAGGSYVYATRALDPFLGFLASFAQWFGLSMGMGVVAYLIAPMLRDTLRVAGAGEAAALFDLGGVRVPIALGTIWVFWWVNRRGIGTYQKLIIAMAAATVMGPVIMTIAGFMHTPADFVAAVAAAGAPGPPEAIAPTMTRAAFFGAVVLLFSSFIGFDAIAQAGGEARDARRSIPRSIMIAMGAVTLYYLLFSAAVYHAVPWQHIYRVSMVQDASAPALLAPLLPAWANLVILLAVSVAIIDSIPSVMLANSRMVYAFAADRLFPAPMAALHPRFRTPHHALTLTAVAGSLSVIGCHVGGDFFLGVDVLVLSMLLNFVLMSVALITFPRVNPHLYRDVGFLTSRGAQVAIAVTAAVLLGGLLAVQVVTDLSSAQPWYMRSTWLWLAVMTGASLMFARAWARLRREGIDPRTTIFGRLPDE